MSCHCEEAADEAIPAWYDEIASAQTPRNDGASTSFEYAQIERQLQYTAARAGVAPETYVLGLLQQDLRRATQDGKVDRSLPRQEAVLLRKINRSLSQIQWERYDQLLAKRRTETLTPEELDELIALSDQIEAANVRRIKYLAELARLRNTTVSALIAELGIHQGHVPMSV